jgi:hypothetical protein
VPTVNPCLRYPGGDSSYRGSAQLVVRNVILARERIIREIARGQRPQEGLAELQELEVLRVGELRVDVEGLGFELASDRTEGDQPIDIRPEQVLARAAVLAIDTDDGIWIQESLVLQVPLDLRYAIRAAVIPIEVVPAPIQLDHPPVPIHRRLEHPPPVLANQRLQLVPFLVSVPASQSPPFGPAS